MRRTKASPPNSVAAWTATNAANSATSAPSAMRALRAAEDGLAARGRRRGRQCPRPGERAAAPRRRGRRPPRRAPRRRRGAGRASSVSIGEGGVGGRRTARRTPTSRTRRARPRAATALDAAAPAEATRARTARGRGAEPAASGDGQLPPVAPRRWPRPRGRATRATDRPTTQPAVRSERHQREPRGERPPGRVQRRCARRGERRLPSDRRAGRARGRDPAGRPSTHQPGERRDPERRRRVPAGDRPADRSRGTGGLCPEPCPWLLMRGSSTTIRQPPAGRALGADRAAVGVDDPARDRQAEARAAVAVAAAVEALEDPLESCSAGCPGPRRRPRCGRRRRASR